MKNITKISIAILSCVGLMTGCGGGSSDGGIGGSRTASITKNATLDSPAEAAQILAAFGLAAAVQDQTPVLDVANFGSACNQNNEQNSGSRTINSLSFTEVDATFDNCDTRITDGADMTDIVLDGRIRATCNSGTLQDCANLSATIGDGSARLLADVEITENGIRTTDAVTTSTGTLQVVTSSAGANETVQITTNLSATVNDQLSSRNFALATENLQVNATGNDNDDASTTTVSGALSLTGLMSCLDGGVNISTDNAITTNANGDVTSGQLRFGNNAGQTATAAFLAGGNFSITANGTTETFTPAQLQALCN